MGAKNYANVLQILILKYSCGPSYRDFRETGTWSPFLETPDNFPGPKTILGAQNSPVAIQFLLILKVKF